tara:strand:+ start:440 stop:676 length:237 start_codon:yes stop_codon:yes gene_type:complete
MFLFYRYKNVGVNGKTNWSKISRSYEKIQEWGTDDLAWYAEEVRDCPEDVKIMPLRLVEEEWHLEGFKIVVKNTHYIY